LLVDIKQLRFACDFGEQRTQRCAGNFGTPQALTSLSGTSLCSHQWPAKKTPKTLLGPCILLR